MMFGVEVRTTVGDTTRKIIILYENKNEGTIETIYIMALIRDKDDGDDHGGALDRHFVMRLQVHIIVVSRARAYNIVPGSGHRWSSGGGGGSVTTSNRFRLAGVRNTIMVYRVL